MDRCAIFVDAGYLLSAGGWLCCNQPRAGTRCDYKAVTETLRTWCSTDAGLPVLRLYWYDGAPNLVPSPDHNQLAALTEVKVRLGRVTGGEQKGVDSRIVRDLITLSRERAMETAYLLSGDEDLREGVAEAQDVGVRVVLLGLPPTRRSRQSYTLIAEADKHVVLDKEFWVPFFSPAAPATLLPAPPPAPLTAPVELPAPPSSPAPADGDLVDEAAREYARASIAGDEGRRRTLLDGRPAIPREIDVGLLQAVSARLGRPIRTEEETRRRARVVFWQVVTEHVEE
jgi:uncharacterized LabA/DUF88 family protein